HSWSLSTAARNSVRRFAKSLSKLPPPLWQIKKPAISHMTVLITGLYEAIDLKCSYLVIFLLVIIEISQQLSANQPLTLQAPDWTRLFLA
ncbi:MAG: hypothetical protein H6Q72_4915, partial [Firmicutes bacterium]|nr:hypothetical protein [Bacillota bacterium]